MTVCLYSLISLTSFVVLKADRERSVTKWPQARTFLYSLWPKLSNIVGKYGTVKVKTVGYPQGPQKTAFLTLSK